MTTAPAPATTETARRRRVAVALALCIAGWVFDGVVHGDWIGMARLLWGAFVVGLNLAVAWFIAKWIV